MERQKVTSIPVTTFENYASSVIYSINHQGSFKTLQRITGYMLRFMKHIKKQEQPSDINLTVDELEEALMVIIRAMQKSDFGEDLRHLWMRTALSELDQDWSHPHCPLTPNIKYWFRTMTQLQNY